MKIVFKSKNAGKAILLLLISAHFSCVLVARTAFLPPQIKKSNWYRGVYHVHSNYSHDSKATLEMISETAGQAGLDFIVVTDHNNMDAKKAYQPKPKDPLLIVGTEISTWHDGHLGVIGVKEMPPDIGEIQKILDWIHAHHGFAIPAHPYSKRKPWKAMDLPKIDAIEIFCFSDLFYENTAKLMTQAIFFPSDQFLKSALKVNPEGLQWWDNRLSAGEQISALAATDAHLKWRLGNFYAENLLLYFQSVTMYAHADQLNSENIVRSLANGNTFIAFEIFGIAQDFSFTAAAENRVFHCGETALGEHLLFHVKVPKEADIKLIHNGKIVEFVRSQTLEYSANEPGYYRVEVYEGGKLWILTNPIYFTQESGLA